jgi:predicted acetyltransferase
MRALRLIGPSRDFESSYRSLVDEIRSRGEKPIPFPVGFPHDDFGELIARLERNSKGEGLPAGFVANSTYWLVAQSEIVGVSNLRHSLTPRLRREGGNIGYGVRPSARGRGLGAELLRQTLGKAKETGLTRVLLTCGKDNVPSVRVILANRGVFESEEFLEERNEVIQRYWIDLAQPARGR